MDETSKDDTFFDLIKRPGLRSKTFMLTVMFIGCILGYCGILADTVNMEADRQLKNYFLLSFIDLPALLVCWKLIDSPLGRRWTNVFSMLFCGISLIIPQLLMSNNEILFTTCTMFGKFFVAGTFMIIYQHASELFPTTLRNQGLGLTATIGSLVSTLVPVIVYLVKQNFH